MSLLKRSYIWKFPTEETILQFSFHWNIRSSGLPVIIGHLFSKLMILLNLCAFLPSNEMLARIGGGVDCEQGHSYKKAGAGHKAFKPVLSFNIIIAYHTLASTLRMCPLNSPKVY